jgi:hypothetical protein
MRLHTCNRILITLALLLGTHPAEAIHFSTQHNPDLFDIGSAGQPMIIGNLGGSVIGSPGNLSDLSVTVDFGELSPTNRNRLVKVTIPIAIRSADSYQVSVAVSAAASSDPMAVQLSDIGFGIQNLRRLGSRGTPCAANSTISPLFNHDPAVTANFNGAVAYQSTLANISGSTVIIKGPKLTTGTIKPRRSDNGWAFDAVLTVAPQYYTPGNFSLTLVFTITPGTPLDCFGAPRF